MTLTPRKSAVAPVSSCINTGAFSYYVRLGRVRRYVMDHYAEPISLSEIAQVAGLERTYFSTFFHDKTGVLFRDWLASIRVDMAVKLICQRNSSIRRVATETGFSSLRTFERAFLKAQGLSPSSFRKRVRPSNRSRTGDPNH